MGQELPRLTPAEQAALEIVSQWMRKRGRGPSMRELGEELGVTKSAAQQHMTALRLKGRLEGPRIVGTWELTDLGKKETEGT